MTKTSTYPLRLPASVKAEAERLAAEDGTSLNQFVATAVAEKLAALRTAAYFIERSGRGDRTAFRALLTREGGAPPQPGDELPAGRQGM
ncbi:YlcI/YnfO family protein [Azospirillum sp. B4]|uniref:YlcI/YnfO family protein n=1 Tax=Azospirillum sp. B4 TaxID=95605 RepID=UPI00034D8C97|nr:YlcI/YnfO family protein [Azospirillum sp. B4]